MFKCNESHILAGPEDDYSVPKESFGKIIFDCLRKRDPEDVVWIDAITKDVLTCQKLLQDSIKLTAILKALGIQKGDAIAVVNENSINYFTVVLAAFYMAVAVNPLNPDFSVGELRHGLEISKAKLVLCSEKALQTVLAVKLELQFIETVLLMGPTTNHYRKIKRLEDLSTLISADTASFTPEDFDCSEQTAFIFLSSGTTGLPKGVMITHGNMRASINCFRHPKYGNTTSEDTTIICLPFFHMYGLLILIYTIVASVKAVIMDKFKPDIFLKCIQQHSVTKLFTAPPVILFLAKSTLVKNYDISSLKDIIVGGAPLSKELQIKATKSLATTTIRQALGLTEVGMCTFQTIDTDIPGTVGSLIPGVTSKVWNPDTNKAVGPLETGELCFKGSMVMKGYIPAQCHIDEDGFYHSGDMGYYDHDGLFYIVDRLKDIIKYKAFQVAPAELEALIITHPLVSDCGVIGVPDERAGEVPVAFVVLENGADVSEQEIVDFVAEKISTRKRLYGGVRFIHKIPKTPSGKILRKNLVKMYQALKEKV